jgi:pyruvate dehydrogenase E2 component (dihydrolipoamide acetyltransferase)
MQALFDRFPPWPTGDFSVFGEVEVKPLGRIQQITAAHLGRNWVAIPHVTHHDQADVTDLDERRKAWNQVHPDARQTLLVPIIKAVIDALDAWPVFATSLDADGASLVWKKYRHIGIATDTPNGLLVPVIRDCDAKGAPQLATEIAAIAEKARTRGLSMAEMSGGVITISSLGHIGGTGFTPIVNAPEVAILGVTRTRSEATPAPDGTIAWRQMLPLSLSYDHRVINGADAARFVRHIADRLAAYRFA